MVVIGWDCANSYVLPPLVVQTLILTLTVFLSSYVDRHYVSVEKLSVEVISNVFLKVSLIACVNDHATGCVIKILRKAFSLRIAR